MTTAFGTALKDWRTRRNLSQLSMALAADVSARHVSFLETGRARPSRGMILRLCEVLDLPRPARNGLLTSAGLAPAYPTRDSDAADLAPLAQAVEWTLERHAPYPAFAIDRHWTLTRLNHPATILFGSADLGAGDNLTDALCDNPALRDAIENYDEVVCLSILRLRTENAHLGGDPALDAAIARLEAAASPTPPPEAYPAVIPARYKTPLGTLSLFNTIAQFGSAEDLAFADIKIELMFPADDLTKSALEQMANLS